MVNHRINIIYNSKSKLINNQNHQNYQNNTYIVNMNNINFNNLLNHYNHLLNSDTLKIIQFLYGRQYEALLKYIHKNGSIKYIENFNISNYIQKDISVYWFSTFFHLFFKYQLLSPSSYVPLFYINFEVIDFLWLVRLELMSIAFIQILDDPSFSSESIPIVEFILKNKKIDVLNLNLNYSQINNLFNNSLLYGTLHTYGLVKSVFPNFKFQITTALITNLISVGYSKLNSIYYLFQLNLLPNLLHLIGESNISRLVVLDVPKVCLFRNSIPVFKDMLILIYNIIKIQNNNYSNNYLDSLYNSINKS